MLKQKIRSFDGRELNVFTMSRRADRSSVVLALPFGVRHQIAAGLYRALAADFNVVTWESRFVLDHDSDAADATITADMHARDLERVIRHARGADPAPMDVIGYCSGAGVALLAAALFPEAIARLALVSGEYMLPPSRCRQSRFQRDVDALLPMAAGGRASAGMLFEKIAAGRGAPQSEFHQFISLPFSSAEHLYRYGLNYVAYRQVDFLQTCAAVPHPVMLMLARGDQHVTAHSSEIVYRHLRRPVRQLEIEGDHYELCRGNRALTGPLTHFLGAP